MKRTYISFSVFAFAVCSAVVPIYAATEALMQMGMGMGANILGNASGGASQTLSQLQQGNADQALVSGLTTGLGVMQQAQQAEQNLKQGAMQAVLQTQQQVYQQAGAPPAPESGSEAYDEDDESGERSVATSAAVGGAALGVAAASAAASPTPVTISVVDQYLAFMGEPPTDEELPDLLDLKPRERFVPIDGEVPADAVKSANDAVAKQVKQMLGDPKIQALLDRRAPLAPEKVKILGSDYKRASFMAQQEVTSFYEDVLFDFMDYVLKPPALKVAPEGTEMTPEDEKYNVRVSEEQVIYDEYLKAERFFERRRDTTQMWEEFLSYFADVTILKREGALLDLKDFIQNDADGKPREPREKKALLDAIKVEESGLSALTEEELSADAKKRAAYIAIRDTIINKRSLEDESFDGTISPDEDEPKVAEDDLPAAPFLDECEEQFGVDADKKDTLTVAYISIKDKLTAARATEDTAFLNLLATLNSYYAPEVTGSGAQAAATAQQESPAKVFEANMSNRKSKIRAMIAKSKSKGD